jgi:hypothetical protein
MANVVSSSCQGHPRQGLRDLGSVPKPGVASQSLHESGAGAGTTGGQSANKPVRTGDNGCHRRDPSRGNRSAAPTSSTRRAVFHRAGQGVNPDASLSSFDVGDNDADARHGQGDPGALSGSAYWPLGGIDGGRLPSTACRSRGCPGRSGCRSPPGSDNGHS